MKTELQSPTSNVIKKDSLPKKMRELRIEEGKGYKVTRCMSKLYAGKSVSCRFLFFEEEE
jgi:hypothetical protein